MTTEPSVTERDVLGYVGQMSSTLAGLPLDTLQKRTVHEPLLEMTLALRAVDIERLARFVKLPIREVGASPFGLRAVALGASTGAFHLHRELTHVPAFGDDERVRDERHGRWENGVLQTGKYQAFMQEAPLSIFDPSHIAKWGPHELLHRACGYFWREDASDFEFYLAARLGEALPVSLWYDADQILRDEPLANHRDLKPASFVREASEKKLPHAPSWWTADEGTLHARLETEAFRLKAFVDAARVHLEAVRIAAKSGRMPSAKLYQGTSTLDAESDAMAYCVGHRARLRDPDMHEVLASAPHFETVLDYADHIESVLERLLYAEIDWTLGESEKPQRAEWHQAFQRALGGDEAAEADGVHGIDLAILAEGLEESLPNTFDWLEANGGDWLEDFANSDALWQRAPLGERLLDFLEARGDIAPSGDLARLESLFLKRRPDPRCEELSDPEGTHLIRSAAFTLEHFESDPHALMEGDQNAAPVSLLVGVAYGQAVSFPADAAMTQLWEQLERGPVELEEATELVGEELVATLLEAAVVSRFAPLTRLVYG